MPSARRNLPHGASDESERGADEIDRLIAELRDRGIDFLTGGRDDPLAAEVAAHPLAPTDLLRRLASCPEPSVRDATIALLLLHPELAAHLPPTTPARADATTQQLAALALAAAYLQRIWRTRLALALGEVVKIPVRYWREWRLPDPDAQPEYGLRLLAGRERDRTGRHVNYLAMWQRQVDQLLAQVWRAHRRARRASSTHQGPEGGEPAPETMSANSVRANHQSPDSANTGAMGMPHAPRGGAAMSMRAPVDRERIERFLTRLGAQVSAPGRIYLVGGTTMVYEGVRATTVDIDLYVEADDPGAITAAIRSLKDALDVNVEFASPRDFIPLPQGWRERGIYLGRYGSLDIFHFDLYSMALSKIERGAERDFQDVIVLVRSGRIDPDQLDAAFNEVLPRVATEGMASMDPDIFAEHYRYLRSLLGPQP